MLQLFERNLVHTGLFSLVPLGCLSTCQVLFFKVKIIYMRYKDRLMLELNSEIPGLA